MRRYEYVGPPNIRDRCAKSPPTGVHVHSATAVLDWLRTTGQLSPRVGEIIVTFVVDTGGRLLIADRHSEHVACAGGAAVLSAGEMTFAVESNSIRVVGVSNQSTGYCPEPESWPAVALALATAGLLAPPDFTLGCIFRRCAACGEKCIVKDGVFECLLCGAGLPREYNCQATS